MKSLFLLIAIVSLFFFSCSNQSTATDKVSTGTKIKNDSTKILEPVKTKASAAGIMARKEVPVLCYHHIRNVASTRDLKNEYEVSIIEFKSQMKALADSGYKSVTPDQLYNYLVYGGSLPDKPFVLTYDDTDEEQFSVAKPEMDKYGFKGVYFIMTISIGRPNYMTKEQIKQLSDEGHVIASHTWDHSRVDKYTYEHAIEEGGKKKVVNDWDQQLVKTKLKLEGIIEKPIDYFAYPFGVWSKAGIPEIEKRGYKMAFQLATKRDSLQPLYTVRRVIVAPQWSAEGLLKVMRTSFK